MAVSPIYTSGCGLDRLLVVHSAFGEEPVHGTSQLEIAAFTHSDHGTEGEAKSAGLLFQKLLVPRALDVPMKRGWS